MAFMMVDPPLPQEHIEYRILRNISPIGSPICRFGDVDVYEFIRDEWGRMFRYAGVTAKYSRGEFAAISMEVNEFILPPGILYHVITPQRASFGQWFKEGLLGCRDVK